MWRRRCSAAGVSPSKATIEEILRVDLLGTAILLEEVRKVIAPGGVGVTISSQSGWRLKQLTPEEDRALAMTPTEELLDLELLQPENIVNTLHAYQLAKRCNEKRTMYEAVEWGKRGARLNDIAPGIIVTPLVRGRMATVCENVVTVTTPGDCVDVLVTITASRTTRCART